MPHKQWEKPPLPRGLRTICHHHTRGSDRQFIRPPPAGLDDLCGIRRSSNASLSSTYPENIGATPADYSISRRSPRRHSLEGKVDRIKGDANLWLAKLDGIKGAGVYW